MSGTIALGSTPPSRQCMASASTSSGIGLDEGAEMDRADLLFAFGDELEVDRQIAGGLQPGLGAPW